jgi:hypothetical protein
MLRLHFCIVALFVLPCLGHAQVRWEKTQLDFYPSASDTQVKAVFNFTNTGPDPVTIGSIVPECGCTTANADKKTYNHNENGHVVATFTIGRLSGIQNKRIVVMMNGVKEATILSIVAHLPKPVQIIPSTVSWLKGELPKPKIMKVTIPPGAGIRITKVTSSDPNMKATVEAVQEGKEYTVVITPGATTTPGAAILWIECAFSPNDQRTLTAYACIKP